MRFSKISMPAATSLIFFLVSFFWAPSFAKGAGNTWTVRPDGTGSFPNIQSAVNGASGGDTILLADGVYKGAGNKDVLVSGKNLTIRAQGGAQNCVVDCEGSGRGFFFQGSGVTTATVLRGVTIQNGDVTGLGANGGGILCEDSSPTILDCRLIANRANFGGGIYSTYSIFVDRCSILGNFAASGGGGIFLYSSGPAPVNPPRSSILNCVIANNSSSSGGGISMATHALIHFCTITQNSATVKGGGIYMLFLLTGDSQMLASVVWENHAVSGGEQIYADVFPTFCFVFPSGKASVDIQWPDIGPAGTNATFFSSACGFNLKKYSNVSSVDPAFVDSANGNYHLSSGSPCIDKTPVIGLLANVGDIDNQPRLMGGSVGGLTALDLGADEFRNGTVLSNIYPGIAGEVNSVSVSNALPGEQVFFFTGAVPVPLFIGFGACPTLTLDILNPVFLLNPVADANGRASFSQPVSAAAFGAVVYVQAIGFNPLNPSMGCAKSNLVRFVFL